ncbi:hypothetical protein C8R44DRAFT_795787 [Mycena epipterygia]|nr:hypothetical protein C8R44DRAFT_795787 [Mycena epipterygia]
MSHRTTITELPEDILLDLSQHFDVADLMNIVATCRVFRALQLHKSFWLNIFARIRSQMHPLPFFKGEDLATLSLEDLQTTARRVNRLLHNFHSDSPYPVHIRNLSIEPSAHFFCIPGTSLAVSYTISGVSCWNILTSHRVAYLEINDLRVRSRAPCMETKGEALIVATIGNGLWNEFTNLVAICIDYRDRTQISISHVVSPDMNIGDVPDASFFVTPRVLGFYMLPSLVSWSMQANAAVQTEEDFHDVIGGSCQPLGGHLYLFNPGSFFEDAAVQSLPLPSSSNDRISTPPPPRQITPLAIPYSVASNQGELRACARLTGSMILGVPRLLAPDHGIFAVTHRTFTWENRRLSVVHFWPARTIRDQLHFGPACFYEHSDPIQRIVVGASGTYAILVVVQGKGYLGLVHFSATPRPHITYRKLDIGRKPVDKKTRVALDDALGLVLVGNDSGRLTAFSYA